ncbi:MAG: nucleotidyltransferase family protein [Leptolyngbya sp. SIO1D8]|nr:nucleotidyltransferase family protein [Leptolyngbya sp. SIO1D8]
MKTLFAPIRLPEATDLTISPEVELMLCCARVQLTPEIAERIQCLLRLELDWKLLIIVATQHRVLPLLLQHLEHIAPDQVPANILAHLRTFFNRHIFGNLSQTAEIVKLIELLKKNDVPAIPFKGPTLALSVYGKVTLRQFDDLDILVAPANFLKARQILLEQGEYQQPLPSIFISVEQERSHLQTIPECSLVHPKRKIVIDLHQKLTGGTFITYPFDFAVLQQRLTPVPNANSLLTLCPEDLLLYLCVHGAKSLWERLVWICDVAELVKANPEINWEALLAKAQAAKIERMLLIGLRLTQQLLGTPLPAIVEARIEADSEAKTLANQVHHNILSGKCGLTTTLTFEKLRFQCRTLSSSQEQMCYLMRCFYRHGLTPIRRLLKPTVKDSCFIKLPIPLHFLYYLIRPVRLFSNVVMNDWKDSQTQSSEQVS